MANTISTNRSAARHLREDQRTIPITSRYLNMRTNGRMSLARRAKWFLPVFAAVLMLAAMPKLGWGQVSCPTGLTSCSIWHQVTGFVSMGGNTAADCPPYLPVPPGPPPSSCCLQVIYCWQCCNGVLETYVEQVTPFTALCDGVTPQDMILFASTWAGTDAVQQAINTGMGCDVKIVAPCTDAQLVVQAFLATCWTQATLSGQYNYTICSDPGCYCVTTFDACWDGTNIETSDYEHYTSGTCDCTAAPGSGAWIDGTCYAVCD